MSFLDAALAAAQGMHDDRGGKWEEQGELFNMTMNAFFNLNSNRVVLTFKFKFFDYNFMKQFPLETLISLIMKLVFVLDHLSSLSNSGFASTSFIFYVNIFYKMFFLFKF